MIHSFRRKLLLALIMGLSVPAVVVFATLPDAHGASPGPLKYAELPNPMERGPYKPHRTDPIILGTYNYEETNGNGKAPGTTTDEPFEGQIRGVMFTPEGDTKKSPLIVFMAGNFSACDTPLTPSGQQGCAVYKRNDEGYAYIGENLASWGYTVYSIDEDELINRQDGTYGKGMHARRSVMMATLDKLKEASEKNVPEGPNSNVGSLLDGKLDMSRIGMVGHSRGGDSVSSFILYDQTRPKGERYPLRAVISIAPVDYERHAPYGVPYMTIMASCDGDVSNLTGAHLYQRSLFQNDDPYPRYQVMDVGGDHNGYNTVWQQGEDDGAPADAACSPGKSIEAAEKGTGVRLSGEAGPLMGSPGNTLATSGYERSYKENNTEKLNPEVNTEISGNPKYMGDQEKLGLSTMAAFLRRYVGGEGAMEPYLTGELAAEGKPDVPESACPESIEGKRIPCLDRVKESYMAPPDEREEVLVPGTEDPTTVDELGTAIEASGFANPYLGAGIAPRAGSTAGLAWCDPEPEQQEPGLLKEPVEYPTAPAPCPNPLPHDLGGQGTNETPGAPVTSAPREHAYVNGSSGRQLAVAWEGPAHMSMAIPAKDGNVSGFRALYMSTAVNFFDPRNPPRNDVNPLVNPQNFIIAVSDSEGHEASVEAANPHFGTALQQTIGNTSDRVHVILEDLRVPLAEFSKQGVNLSKLRKLELRFGGEGMPTSGSIELSNIRFQQPATGYSNVYLESTEPNAGPGNGIITSGPNVTKEFQEGVYKRADGEYEIPNVTRVPGANVWTVSNNGSCPNAQFTTIQEAVNYASPWDTIVVCPGVYEESSKPINSEPNPVSAEGEMDGLTINKPLKIIGAGASQVTIKPAPSLLTLGGATGTLRDGGGNVITVSRGSLGSTEYDELYVDISGVKIESGADTAEADVAFFNSSGRIADSEIGTIKPVNGNGWGVVATNSILADPITNPYPIGAPERNVTLENDVIKGYTSGGVMIDDSQGGVDGAATNYVKSNMGEVGYIKGSRIEGSGGTATVGQTGVAYRSGASGEIINSTITKNHSTSTSVSSNGILFAEAGTVTVKNSNITANGAKGYGLYNASAEATGVSTGASIEATGDFWGGSTGAPKTGESVLTPTEEEGVEGPVTHTPFSAAAIKYPTETAVPAMPEAPPGGSIVNPASGESVEAGVAIEPVVGAIEEPSVVHSVSLKANGVSLGVRGELPYTFTWTPTKAEIGKTVELEATISTNSGQTTTSIIKVPVVKSAAETATEKAAAETAAAEKAAAEAKAAAKASEEAAAKSAAEVSAQAVAAAKLAEEDATKLAAAVAKLTAESASEAAVAAALAEELKKAAAAFKAAEEKAAMAAKQAAEAKQAAAEAAEKAGVVFFAASVQNTKRGTARLGVVVPKAGTLLVNGPGIHSVTVNATGPGEVGVTITASASAMKTLQKKGKVSVSVTATLTASSGSMKASTTVALAKNKKKKKQ